MMLVSRCGTLSHVGWGSDTLTLSSPQVYDFEAEERISFIPKPPQSPPADMCPCHMYWEDDQVRLLLLLL